MKNIIMPGEHALVVGPSLPYQPFTIPGYIWKSFGADTQWTVVLPDSFPKTKNLTTEVIHASDVTSLDYDRIFVFSPDARLVGLYSETGRKSDPQRGRLSPNSQPSADVIKRHPPRRIPD